ncbi:oligosaccharide flippase family protein [Spirosoma endophyticum]|uniref:Membrane protein involved in the export of O-antigen and teichoic acid n=1 Tax=Spirosoma endophyticum TaxID=662367 RepID=A0A1I1QY52_9BACT|nr:oligosaccharide flippase family protein [Spirosoma endophyticum]SFD22970.1 Membrane protein involved in the export of O-antigen and teichoic acid [Spirosoma endophyticum]
MILTALGQLQKRIATIHPRTRNLHINSVLGLISKAGSMLVSLLLVPITISYLTQTTYGTWVTISSMSSLLAFVDLGIGNGLRNKLAEAASNQNPKLAQLLVSTAYALFGLLQGAFILLFLILANYIPWSRVLNSSMDPHQLRLVVLIVAIAMAVKLVLDMLSYVLLALQESSRVNLINFLINLLVLIGTYGVSRFTNSNVVYLALVAAGSPLVVLGISSWVLYQKRLIAYRPTFTQIRFKQARQILSLGYTFFLIQLAFIVVFYTDNLLINQFFGSAAVASYNIAFRYFTITNTLFGLVIVPYWSAFTEAFVKQDVAWMQRTHQMMYRLWAGLVGVVILMVLVAQPVYSVWVGQRIHIPSSLNLSLGLFVVITGWNLISSTVTNSAGKMRLQIWYALACILTNIPLAFLLSKTLGLGSSGVVLASVVSLGYGAVLGPIQAHKLIKGTASGIWNR